MSNFCPSAQDFAIQVISHFYPEDDSFRRLLMKHSFQVCRKAETILHSPGCPLRLDDETVVTGALLHDIGIGRCHAPDIGCHGDHPYIAHGVIGAEMLRNYGAASGLDLEKYARICERHTGTGLTAEDIRRQNLPLPVRDYLPETPEEKLICLADKFFSKSGTMQEKGMAQIVCSMRKFGPENLIRWEELCRMFGIR